jgi:hypothetical protein
MRKDLKFILVYLFFERNSQISKFNSELIEDRSRKPLQYQNRYPFFSNYFQYLDIPITLLDIRLFYQSIIF